MLPALHLGFYHQSVGIFMFLDVQCVAYLERVKAGDDSAVLHLTALGGVGELALLVGARAGAPLELSADLQSQPFCVAHMCYVHRHGSGSGFRKKYSKKLESRV